MKDLTNRLEKDGPSVEVRGIWELDGEMSLTPRQKTILRMALEEEYFEFPRRISKPEEAGRQI